MRVAPARPYAVPSRGAPTSVERGERQPRRATSDDPLHPSQRWSTAWPSARHSGSPSQTRHSPDSARSWLATTGSWSPSGSSWWSAARSWCRAFNRLSRGLRSMFSPLIPTGRRRSSATRFDQPFAEQDLIVFESESLVATDLAFQAVIGTALDRAEELPGVVSVIGPFDPRAEGLVAEEGHVATAVIGLSGSNADRQALAPRLTQAAASAATDEVRVYVTGRSPLIAELVTQQEADLSRAERLGLPVALLILLISSGAVVAAGLPLVLAMSGVIVTFGVLGAASTFTEFNLFVPNIASMIGLGVGIDYALFIVNRFREELVRGSRSQPRGHDDDRDRRQDGLLLRADGAPLAGGAPPGRGPHLPGAGAGGDGGRRDHGAGRADAGARAPVLAGVPGQCPARAGSKSAIGQLWRRPVLESLGTDDHAPAAAMGDGGDRHPAGPGGAGHPPQSGARHGNQRYPRAIGRAGARDPGAGVQRRAHIAAAGRLRQQRWRSRRGGSRRHRPPLASCSATITRSSESPP